MLAAAAAADVGTVAEVGEVDSVLRCCLSATNAIPAAAIELPPGVPAGLMNCGATAATVGAALIVPIVPSARVSASRIS